MLTLMRPRFEPALAMLDESGATFTPSMSLLPHEPRRDDRSSINPAARQQATGAGEPGPILVVDDNLALLDAVCEALQDENYPVIAATDGEEALQLIADHHPSLILLDMRLPVLNGWEVVRALKARGGAAPVVVMTAAQDAAAWAAEVGAAGYLAKPFELGDLLTMVERLRERRDD